MLARAGSCAWALFSSYKPQCFHQTATTAAKAPSAAVGGAQTCWNPSTLPRQTSLEAPALTQRKSGGRHRGLNCSKSENLDWLRGGRWRLEPQLGAGFEAYSVRYRNDFELPQLVLLVSEQRRQVIEIHSRNTYRPHITNFGHDLHIAEFSHLTSSTHSMACSPHKNSTNDQQFQKWSTHFVDSWA